MEATTPAATERPRLRRDLEFTHRQAGGEAEVILCDPLAGRYFRAGELEAALFALLDGETPLDAIAARMASDFPGLAAEDVPAFVAQLDRMGFLEGSTAVHARPRPPLHRRLLYAQLRLADPDRLFTRLLPYVGWLYRPAGWAAAALLFLVAGSVAAVSQEELLRQTTPTGAPEFWLRLWIGLSLISTLHEFGHGLTCRYFGGRSAGVGLLWMYGLPCFYCDVSGAWMLPKKSQRIWVGAAGLYYQFLAGAVALLLWRVLEPGTVVSDLLVAMAASCGLLSLFNLNPLLKLDGYYLLSDWLEIPNLRQRAFDTLGQRLSRFWFGEGGGGETGRRGDGAIAREQRICLAYATLSALFLIWLLTRLLWNMGGLFIGRLGGAGALLFLLVAAAALGTPAARACAACGRRLARWKEIPAMGRRRLLLAGGALLLVPLALVVGRWELHLTSPCKLDAAARAMVRARTDGRVAELTTREGARVRRGEVVGHLATFEREQALRDRQAQLQMVRLQVAALADRLPIVAAQAARAMAEAATGARDARTRLTEDRETLPGRAEEAQRRAEAARADLEEAGARLVEARAAVEAQSRIAGRVRGDADRAARGDDPPALAVAREQWRRRVVEAALARQDRDRIVGLVKDGAMAPQQRDAAEAHDEAASRRAAEALQSFTAAAKSLREAADDAEAELARRRAALESTRAAQAAARANEAAAREAAHQVAATSRPGRLEIARLRAASGEAQLSAARVGQREILARRAEIHVKRQEAERLAAQIAVLRDQIRRSDLVAPCDGVVTTPRVEERFGAHFDEGDAVLDVEDPASIFTRIFVNEKELGDIRTGQSVALRVAAYPDRIYRGRVSEIAPRAVPGGSAAFPTNIVEVRLRVENPTGELRPGMSGWAKIDCGPRSLGAILFRRLSRYVRNEVWSWF